MISLIINTCSLGDQSSEVLSSGRRPHEERVWLLRNLILPRAESDPYIEEIIVVGEFEPDPHGVYTYIESPSKAFDCTDALHQRQEGFEASTQPWVIFQHDDHLIGDNAAVELASADILLPWRGTRARDWRGERLNNGSENGYISGHVVVGRREAFKEVPWGRVPKVFTWDMSFTRMVEAAGLRWKATDRIKVWDMERGAEPWK